MTGFSDWVDPYRARAAGAAADRLRERGFERQDDGWAGTIECGGCAAPVRLVLPRQFPDVLPEIYLTEPRRERSDQCLAHVERNGKLCLAPPSGVLIDVDRPADIVDAALDRANSILRLPADEAARDIQAEYNSYWGSDRSAYSALDANSNTGPVVVALPKKRKTVIVANSRESAANWARMLRLPEYTSQEGFLVRAKSLPAPPAHDEQLLLRQFLEDLCRQTDGEEEERLASWLSEHGLPAWIFVGAALSNGIDRTFFGVHIPWRATSRRARRRQRPYSKSPRELAEQGFRQNRVPKEREVQFALSSAVERVGIQRVDRDHLLRRGGGDATLATRSVLLVGCGAVGGYIATLLAASGVHRLVLVDHDVLEPENAYRHVLGLDGVGQTKVAGLRERLRRTYPETSVIAVQKEIEEAVADDPKLLHSANAVVLATGSETLERRLNRYLRSQGVQAVHVWVEAYGIGGHVLRTAPGHGRGCYECLYAGTGYTVLHNGASMLAPDQDLQVTTGGCSGTYTPFAVVDAVRAAEESVRLIASGLCSGPPPEPLLVSWSTSQTPALEAKLDLSKRAALIRPGTTVRESEFANDDCPACAS